MLNWLNRGAKRLLGIGGLVVIPRARYEQVIRDLAICQNLASRRTQPDQKSGHAEKPDALSDDHDHRLAPAIPFPALPKIDAKAFTIHIVDVGAQPLSFEEDIYAPLLRAGDCHIVGFDPFLDSKMDPCPKTPLPPTQRDNAHTTILPYFIGDGRESTFHINHFSPTSSLFPSNMTLMSQFSNLAESCRTKSTVQVETRCLDNVQEIQACDFLKIDVQGGDLDVIAHGQRILKKSLFVHIEAEFSQIYTGQPLFADIDILLRQAHFEFLDFVKLGWSNYKALPSSCLRSRLLWSDCIYMKSPDHLARRDPNLLVRAAFIAHVNYRKYDLAAHLLDLYDRHTGDSLHESYTVAINQALASSHH